MERTYLIQRIRDGRKKSRELEVCVVTEQWRRRKKSARNAIQGGEAPVSDHRSLLLLDQRLGLPPRPVLVVRMFLHVQRPAMNAMFSATTSTTITDKHLHWNDYIFFRLFCYCILYLTNKNNTINRTVCLFSSFIYFKILPDLLERNFELNLWKFVYLYRVIMRL